MTLAGARICLVTSGPVGSDPRLLKEAHALHAAGALVRVVAANSTGLAHVQERDEQVLRDVPWKYEAVGTGGAWGRRRRAIQRRLARAMWAAGLRGDRVAGLALDPLIGAIARAAAREPANLFIAHNLPALPAAASAARAQRARLGFDAEDFHSGQLHASEQPLRGICEAIERRHLPACAHLTAASPGIGEAYARSYGVRTPTVVLNVFPRTLAPAQPTTAGGRQNGRPSLYWFSQTIGPDRGLEDVIAAMALTQSRPDLVLQGSVDAGYRARLEARAHSLGLAGHLRFLPPAPPDELPAVAALHDLGLATEAREPTNRDLCLTNKIFTYLLAGVPVAASATSAQAALAAQLPDCMWAMPLDDAQTWATRVDGLLLQPAALAAARAAAWRAAQERYHWEREAISFITSVEASLPSSRSTS